MEVDFFSLLRENPNLPPEEVQKLLNSGQIKSSQVLAARQYVINPDVFRAAMEPPKELGQTIAPSVNAPSTQPTPPSPRASSNAPTTSIIPPPANRPVIGELVNPPSPGISLPNTPDQLMQEVEKESSRDPGFSNRFHGWLQRLKDPRVQAALLQFSASILNSGLPAPANIANAMTQALLAPGRVEANIAAREALSRQQAAKEEATQRQLSQRDRQLDLEEQRLAIARRRAAQLGAVQKRDNLAKLVETWKERLLEMDPGLGEIGKGDELRAKALAAAQLEASGVLDKLDTLKIPFDEALNLVQQGKLPDLVASARFAEKISGGIKLAQPTSKKEETTTSTKGEETTTTATGAIPRGEISTVNTIFDPDIPVEVRAQTAVELLLKLKTEGQRERFLRELLRRVPDVHEKVQQLLTGQQ